MALLRTSYMFGGFLEYYFRLQFSAFWSMHDKTSITRNCNFSGQNGQSCQEICNCHKFHFFKINGYKF